MQYTKEYFEKNKEKWIHNIPKPNIPGVKFKSIGIYQLDELCVDTYGSQSRVSDNPGERSRKLGESFGGGINWGKPLPILRSRPDEVPDVIDMFGRYGHWVDEGQECWPMVEFECETEQSEIELRLWANRHTYEEPNKVKDLIEGIKKIVSKTKRNDPTKKWFRAILNRTEPHMASEAKDEIVQQLVDIYEVTPNPKPKRFLPLGPKTIIRDYVEPHSTYLHKDVGFKLTKKGSSTLSKDKTFYTGAIPVEHEDKKLLTALKTFKKTGKKTKFALYMHKTITSRRHLQEERYKSKKRIKNFCDVIQNLTPKNKINWGDVFELLGVIPQDIHNEDVKYLIPMKDIKKVNRRKKKNEVKTSKR